MTLATFMTSKYAKIWKVRLKGIRNLKEFFDILTDYSVFLVKTCQYPQMALKHQ